MSNNCIVLQIGTLKHITNQKQCYFIGYSLKIDPGTELYIGLLQIIITTSRFSSTTY